MKTTYLKFICLIVIVMFSCNKNEDNVPQLPTGENTAYYYLNGELIIPEDSSAGVTILKGINYGGCLPPNKSIDININRKGKRLSLGFINGIENIGNISLGIGSYDFCNNTNSIGLFQIQDSNSQWFYYNSRNESGKINIIEISENKKQFKGTFEMNVFDTSGNEIKITNGHFNINLNTL